MEQALRYQVKGIEVRQITTRWPRREECHQEGKTTWQIRGDSRKLAMMIVLTMTEFQGTLGQGEIEIVEWEMGRELLEGGMGTLQEEAEEEEGMTIEEEEEGQDGMGTREEEEVTIGDQAEMGLDGNRGEIGRREP